MFFAVSEVGTTLNKNVEETLLVTMKYIVFVSGFGRSD